MSQEIPKLSHAEAIARAEQVLAVEGMTFGEVSARQMLDGLLSAIKSSRCFYKAMLAGEEVFVLRQSDRAAPAAIRAWAEEADRSGCGTEKVNSAYQTARAWADQDPSRTKWPD